MVQVLQCDKAGAPVRWLTPEQAAVQVVKNNVAWSIGDPVVTLRGGTNAKTGLPSLLALPPIISVSGEDSRRDFSYTPAVSSALIFRRDRHLCAYCGQKFRESELTKDHIYPVSRGGEDTFTNLISSCKVCNGRKDNKTPEEAGMPLLFVPYVPSIYEAFILSNRVILFDQHQFLSANLPKHSRARTPMVH